MGHTGKKSIEEQIEEKGLTAPRVTMRQINAVIVKEQYFQLTEVLTICILTLKNGFSVTGESACASPENFDKNIGEEAAYENAREKVWALEGYLLKQKLYEQSQKESL